MTRAANVVTAAATIDTSAVAAEPSILSALTKNVLDAAKALGVDVVAVQAEAGLDPAWLSDPDARVPLEHHTRMWAAIARHPIGLELGQRLGVEGLGVVGYAVQHGANVGEALDWMQRFRALVHEGVMPAVAIRDEPAGKRLVFTHIVPPVFARMKEPVYAFASGTVAMMRGISGRDARVAFVTFPLPRPEDPSHVERFFECPVAWNGAALDVAFDAAMLDWPLPRSNAKLFGYLASRAEALMAALPAETSFAERARREIGAILAQGEPRLGAVAARLALSERTLHRRLSEEGTGFADLVDAARKERATLLLEDPALSCSEIAYLLGYSEPAVFFRAFKRWTGVSPQAFRKK